MIKIIRDILSTYQFYIYITTQAETYYIFLIIIIYKLAAIRPLI